MTTNSLNNIKNPNSDLMKRGIFRLRRPTKIHHCAAPKKVAHRLSDKIRKRCLSISFNILFSKFNYITWRNMDSKFQMLMKFKCQYGTRHTAAALENSRMNENFKFHHTFSSVKISMKCFEEGRSKM